MLICDIPTIMEQVRDELKCPDEFIEQQAQFDTFDRMQACRLDGDSAALNDEMKAVRQAYLDFCHDTGLDYDTDNRKARIGFFIQ